MATSQGPWFRRWAITFAVFLAIMWTGEWLLPKDPNVFLWWPFVAGVTTLGLSWVAPGLWLRLGRRS